VNDTDARLWHPWLRINRVLRVMLHTRWSAEAWAEVKAEFKASRRAAERDPTRSSKQASPARVILEESLEKLMRWRTRCSSANRSTAKRSPGSSEPARPSAQLQRNDVDSGQPRVSRPRTKPRF
jgi:hypothetical protein